MISGYLMRDTHRNIIWSMTAKLAYTKNEITKLSEAIKRQNELYKSKDVEINQLLYEGYAQNSIWAFLPWELIRVLDMKFSWIRMGISRINGIHPTSVILALMNPNTGVISVLILLGEIFRESVICLSMGRPTI